MEKFEEILLKHHAQKRPQAPLSTLAEIEEIAKFELPEDYKTYLLNYAGFESEIGANYIRLWDADQIIEMNNGYGITENLPNTLAIGGNGSGEFIAIELTDGNNIRIVLSPFIDLDEDYHVEIGQSFTDLLGRLANGKSFFEKYR